MEHGMPFTTAATWPGIQDAYRWRQPSCGVDERYDDAQIGCYRERWQQCYPLNYGSGGGNRPGGGWADRKSNTHWNIKK